MSALLYQRRSICLPEYDYAGAGAYFVTTCVHGRECLFGEIADNVMNLNGFGKVAESCWHDLPKHYIHIGLDAFIVMPNHVHMIIEIRDAVSVGAGAPAAGDRLAPTSVTAPTSRHGLSEIVRAFKSFSSRRINELRNTVGQPVWQRNYFERVIRNEDELRRARDYILNNPLKWALDRENLN